MFVYRTHGVVAATLGALAAGACTDPSQNTDLRPEGPPDLLAVLVMTDASSQLVEKATFCRLNDNKRPGLVGLPDATTQQVCPADLSKPADEVDTAYPDGWYVRIVFDELLDPSVETLTEITDDTGAGTDTYEGSIATTKPVKLECQSVSGSMIEVDYDGYYSPAGNHVTWPVGPSVVVKPNNPTLIASGTPCQITINDVITDKDGNKVPSDERGPYKFGVAPISVISIDPPDDPMAKTPIPAEQMYFDNPYLQFNTAVYSKSGPGTALSMCDDANPDGLCDHPVFEFLDVAHPMEGPGYCNSTFGPCGTIADCGTGDTVCGKGFCSNGMFDTPCNADTDCASGDTCESTYQYSYLPFGLTEREYGYGPVEPIETERAYTFGVHPGSKFKDRCGRETTFTTPNPDDNTLSHFTTLKFGFNKFSIADGETASMLKKFQINMNNAVGDTATAPVGAASLDPAKWDMTPMPVTCTAVGTCSPITKAAAQIISTDGSGEILVKGHLAANTDYTFTLHAGATITDFYGKTYTQADEKVVHWKTAPAIVVSSTTPADKGTVTFSATAAVGVQVNFNQSMDPASLTEGTEFSVTDASGNPVTGFTVAASSNGGCALSGTALACGLRVRKVGLPTGNYTFTLKAGASINDVMGNAYMQAADKVVHFTVKNAAPPPAACL